MGPPGRVSPVDLAVLDAFAAAVTDQDHGGARVLDAGCGTGRLTRHLEQRGCRVEGVDLSPGMIGVARVLRPGGHVVVAFPSGRGARDVGAVYRRSGHDVVLERHLVRPGEVADDLAVLLAQASPDVRSPASGRA